MRVHFTILLMISCSCSLGQVADNFSGLNTSSINAFLEHTSSRIKKIDRQTGDATDKMLVKMQEEESRIAEKIKSKDSLLHSQVFFGSLQFYQKLKENLNAAGDTSQVAELNEYIPYFDTLKSSLAFLNKQESYFNNSRLTEAQQILQQYQNRLQITNTIKQEIQQREQQLKEQLQNLGFIKELKNINRQIYYYQQQLAEYKAAFKDPKKLEAKAIQLLSRNRIFQDFMRKNSMLASLFRIPEPDASPTLADVSGMQTRTSVQQLLSQRFGALSGEALTASPQQYMQQQIQAVQPQLNALKDKLNKLGGGNSDMEMPDFKPGNQKAKSFLKRLEYGINIQSQRGTGLLPVTTDFAATIGYKISDKTAAGFGVAYKMGWGKDISHISISNQGVGLRSYFDAKIKGGIWAIGGFEYNYMQEFQKWSEISSVDVWQKSCLIGLTKKYKVGKRESKVQVLWDFLSYNQVPRGQPLKFRIGFNFR